MSAFLREADIETSAFVTFASKKRKHLQTTGERITDY